MRARSARPHSSPHVLRSRRTLESAWITYGACCDDLRTESSLIDNIIYQRAGNYVRVVVSRMKIEASSPQLPQGRIGLVVLLMKPLVTTLLEWVNQRVRIEDGSTGNISEAAFYRFLALFLFSQSPGMSQDSFITLFGKLGFMTPSACHTSRLGNKLIPFHPTRRVTESAGTWRSQRDATQLLNDFERQAWRLSK